MPENLNDKRNKRERAARACATGTEISVILLILLILAAMFLYLYLNLFVGRMEAYESLFAGATSSLMKAAVVCLIPAFACAQIAEEFDQAKSMDGYIFIRLFELQDKAEARLKARFVKS